MPIASRYDGPYARLLRENAELREATKTLDGIATASTIVLPPGCKHYSTTASAESWEAWDAIAVGLGEWREESWHSGPDCKRCEATDPHASLHVHKERDLLRGGRLIVFPPQRPREIGWSVEKVDEEATT